MGDKTEVRQFDYVVVGGGICGLFSALYIKDCLPDASICVIESSDHFGGLLASQNIGGYQFDYGTHVPRQTGDAEIDALLFSDMDEKIWRSFTAIKTANASYQKDFYPLSQFPYLAGMPDELRSKIWLELVNTLSAVESSQVPSSLRSHLINEFGKTLVEHFFSPVMHKLMDASLDDLHPDAHKFFGLQRLILGSTSEMKQLKVIPEFDRKLAFTRYDACVSEYLNYYPREGQGAGLWVDQLVKKLHELNVELMLNTSIRRVEKNGAAVSAIVVGGQAESVALTLKQLIWSAPSVHLLKLLNCTMPNGVAKPVLRSTVLSHFVFDRPFLVDNCYVYLNSPSFKGFRITLYPNLAGVPDGDAKCTVEQLISEYMVPATLAEIRSELESIGIISASANVVLEQQIVLSNGFPVYTNAFVSSMVAINNEVESAASNLCLLGKGSGGAFFMQDVICQAKSRLQNFVNTH